MQFIFAVILAAMATLAITAFPVNANAATFVVNAQNDAQDTAPGNGICETAEGNGICTLRAAITEANALAGADNITLAGGTYTETLPIANENANAGGDFDITSPITINGAGAATTIIQANPAAQTANERVFHILAGGTAVTINGVTIRNGVNRQAAALGGGGIRVEGAAANLTLNNSTVTNNFSESRGGGIDVNKANLTINNSTFTNNQAGCSLPGTSSAGGGIVIDSEDNVAVAGQTANMTNTVVTGNKAESAVSNTYGGGVYVRAVNAQVTLTGSTISNNLSNTLSASYSAYAGGIYNQQAHMTLINSTVSGNTSSRFFPGIRNLASTQASATLDIINSTVSNNTSSAANAQGGGIGNVLGSNYNATVNIDHSTISGNILTGGASIGGGIVNIATSGGTALLKVTNSTITGNSAHDGAGIHGEGSHSACIVDFSTITSNTAAGEGGGIFQDTMGNTLISNSVFGENVATSGVGIDIHGIVHSGDYNHIQNSSMAIIPAAHDVVGSNPGMSALANNGGPTLTQIPGAIVRNTIPIGTNGCGNPVNTDQRGFARPVGVGCDKGSLEFEGGAGTPTNTPTTTPTNTPTSASTNTPTYTPTFTPTTTATNTPAFTPTNTVTATLTPTATLTNTATATPTKTPTNTPTNTPANTPTSSATNTPTATPTKTPTNTPTNTPANTPTSPATNTPTATPTIPPSITGVITYGNAIGPPATRYVSNVVISSTIGSPTVSAATNSLGAYSLTGFGSGSYTIVPSREDDQSGSISALDAALIAQHVIGIQRLTGNALFVADVSGNGVVNSFDASLVASFVNASPFPHGSANRWRFVPVSTTYTSVTGNIDENYTGFLMGDVSGNWGNTGSRPFARTQPAEAVGSDRPDKSAAVELPNPLTPLGKEVIVPVTVNNVANKGVISYEFDLRYDPSVIQPLADPVGVAGTVSHGFSAVVNATEPGLLRVVVYGALPIDENGLLLNLRFAAIGAPGSVSPLIWERIMFNEGGPGTLATDGRIELSATR